METSILISPEIEKHPSLFAALGANTEAIERLNAEKEAVRLKAEETERKAALAKELKLPSQGMKNAATRLRNKLIAIDKQVKAYSSGYLEIPRLQNRPDTVEFNNSKYWGFRFNKDTPVRILEAVKKAKDAKLFDTLVVFRQGGDPILAGRIADRYFYLGSWR